MVAAPSLEEINHKIDRLLALLEDRLAVSEEWIPASEFKKLVGLNTSSALRYHILKGVFKKDALRNIGTDKKPRYRFHRIKAVHQFLNR